MKSFLKLLKTITLFLFLFPINSFAQQLDHVLGDLLIQVRSEKDLPRLVESFQNFEGKNTELVLEKAIVPSIGMWLLHFDFTNVDENKFLQKIKRNPLVQNAQFNHLLALRSTTPNDLDFPNQWQHLNDGTNGDVNDADMDTDLAWDIATGGLTANGDTIVVCIIDDGIDHDHEDLVEQIWVNRAEIDDNGIDDDNNGFVDDYLGWNSFTNSDANIYNNMDHGTAVAGIIGATGNNTIGVAGISWNVKLMLVHGGSGEESDALIAYSYPLSHRIKYNQTNGAEGAFVVATNSSWGKNNALAADHPLWCAMYDTLGNQGILNCGATANEGYDVEIEGDMPTTCTSDFLIGVTNVTSADVRASSAAYGAISIDLGAPGNGSYSTENSNGYGTFSGTSAAAPQVTGAIGLLYSAPCSNLPSLALNDPAAATLLVKSYILNGVDANADLDGLTTTGGRLNIFNSMQMLMDSCGPCPAPSSLRANNITDVAATLTWVNNDSTLTTNLRYRSLPNGNWTEVFEANSPFALNGLSGCTDYEVQVESTCASEESGYTYSHFFTSEDCCVPPSGLTLNAVTNESVAFSWTSVFAASSYNILLTPADPTIPPVIYNTINTNYEIMNLANCSEFQLQLQTDCDTGLTVYSNPITFFTTGCGNCQDLPYCEIISEDAASEWIGNVTFANLNNTSESNGGYGDFTSEEDTDVDAGMTYTLSITPGYSGSNFLEYFRAWIDYNQDGDFEDEGEIVFTNPTSANTTQTEEVLIPMNAVSGSTRMRVMVRWAGGNMNDPQPCTNIDFGEIEDYCININGGTGVPCSAPVSLDTTNVSLSSLRIAWEAPTNPYESFIFEFRKEGTTTWASIPTPALQQSLLGLEKCSSYEFHVKTVCSVDTESSFSDIFVFQTLCDVNVNDLSKGISEVNIFPNPFSENLTVNFLLEKTAVVEWEIVAMNGQALLKNELEKSEGQNNFEIQNLGDLPQGIYFLKIRTADNFIIKKIVRAVP